MVFCFRDAAASRIFAQCVCNKIRFRIGDASDSRSKVEGRHRNCVWFIVVRNVQASVTTRIVYFYFVVYLAKTTPTPFANGLFEWTNTKECTNTFDASSRIPNVYI